MKFSSWTNVLEQIAERLVNMLPAALGATGLLLLGWIVASILRFLTRKIVVAAVARINSQFRRAEGLSGTRLAEDAPRVIGTLVYWMVLLFFVAAAIDKLPLPIMTDLLQSIAHYLPKVLLAVVIVFLGLGAGILVNRWTTRVAAAAGVEYAPVLGRVAQIAVFVVALLVGAQEIGLESGLCTTAILIGIAATLGGVALSLSLGSGPIVSNIMASYYAAKAYRIGDVVRVAGIEGVVREITPRHWPQVVAKEFAAGLVNGLGVTLTTCVGVYVWSGSTGLVLVIGIAMAVSMAMAGVAGAIIPVFLSKVGQDPAQSSSIALTTVTDVFGFFSFLGLAAAFSSLL